jgi:hypothetical protein
MMIVSSESSKNEKQRWRERLSRHIADTGERQVGVGFDRSTDVLNLFANNLPNGGFRDDHPAKIGCGRSRPTALGMPNQRRQLNSSLLRYSGRFIFRRNALKRGSAAIPSSCGTALT